MASNQYLAQFLELSRSGINEQSKYFLRSFVMDFAGNFEEVLDLAEEFKKFAPPGRDLNAVGTLPEFETHLFLEKRDETLTVKALRE